MSKRLNIRNTDQGGGEGRLQIRSNAGGGNNLTMSEDLSGIIEEVGSFTGLEDRPNEAAFSYNSLTKVARKRGFWNAILPTNRCFKVIYSGLGKVYGVVVGFRDIHHRLEVQLNLECQIRILRTDHGKAVELLLRSDGAPSFAKILEKWTVDYLAQNAIGMPNYLSSEARLIAHLRQLGQNHGLGLDISISPQLEGELAGKFHMVTYEAEYRLKNATIPINHTLVLRLEDKQKLQMAHLGDLKEWFERRLFEATQSTVLEKTYADIVSDIELRCLVGKVEAIALEIGFRVQQLHQIANVEEGKLLDGFFFDTDNGSGDARVLDFSTSDSRIQVRYNFVISGRISRLTGAVSNFLKPGVDIVDLMRNEVLTTARQFLMRRKPEEVYLNMNLSTGEIVEVEKDLANEISARLAKKFDAIDLEVRVNPLPTDLTQRRDQLCEATPFFEFENFSQNIHYKVYYKVLDVIPGGFLNFQKHRGKSPDVELAEISEHLRIVVQEYLNTYLPIDFDALRGADFAQYLLEVLTIAEKRVGDVFGLAVRHSVTERMPTRIENNYLKTLKTNDDLFEIEEARRIENGKALARGEYQSLLNLQERLQEFQNADDFEGMKEVQKQIDAIKERDTSSFKPLGGKQFLRAGAEEKGVLDQARADAKQLKGLEAPEGQQPPKSRLNIRRPNQNS